MRKLVSVTCLLLLFGVACLPAARAQLAGDKFKESTAAQSYAQGYLEVFGRPPRPDEAAHWKNQQMPRSQMIDHLKEWLRKPEGAGDLSATVERAYMNGFGRAPKPDELAFWQSEVKAKHYGYTHILDATRQWLKSPGGAAERGPVIALAYKRAFGRQPKPDETNYWKAQMQKDGTNYSDLVEKCIDWMLGSSPEQRTELRETIQRAFFAVKWAAPNDEQVKYWMTQTSAKRLTFDLLVAQIPKAKL